MTPPLLPSVYSLVMIGAERDPFARARTQALERIEDGLVVLADRPDRLVLALLLEPDRERAASLLVYYAHANAVGDALAAHLPPLLSVSLRWPGTVLVDGARIGRLRLALAENGPIPAWLVLGVELDLSGGPGEPGERPHEAGLAELGAVDLTVTSLAEAWSRHFLTWLDRLEREGFGAVRSAWNARCHDRGRRVALLLREREYVGTVHGIDERGDFRVGEARVPLEHALAELK
ncbi:MAG: hypothetical protein N2038_03560 [Geminicoccaceae bacterium]|nr:hypothetical protein [Geminicoccaceae bacterium]MCX7629308.1 hypothetical protein [Geminicoccaceae bacterium]MDW8341873.1 biotin/lipoate--protein ligase family protein [Geminicoccaceae bacterium]